MLDAGDRIDKLAGLREHLGEVEQPVTALLDPVRFLDECKGLQGELLRARQLAPLGKRLGAHLPGERLGDDIVARAGFRAEDGPAFGLVVAPKRSSLIEAAEPRQEDRARAIQ